MKFKKLTALLVAGALTCGTFGFTRAATREEIASVAAPKNGAFTYWTKDAAAKNRLVAYMKDITNKKSPDYIPVEDRIAVFDMDGTFVCETAPYYFEWMLYLERVLNDKSYTPSEEETAYAKTIEAAIYKKGQFPKNVDTGEAKAQDKAFVGMTLTDYDAYVKKFMEKPVEGIDNLKWGEAFYLPMVEVIKYLQANDFTVYVVSGSDRQTVRILSCDLLKIPANNVIGSDPKITAAAQGDTDGLNYVYEEKDYLVRGELIEKNLKTNKVSYIAREIGKQPVLAFGNSSGDTSMLNYAAKNNKYKSAAFMVLCDDTERELGNAEKAAKCKALADKYGWTSISMRDDFKTIYDYIPAKKR